MWKSIYKTIQRLYSSLFRATSGLNEVVQKAEQPEIKVQVVQEQQAWFQKENNLVAEFASPPTPVYSSNFGEKDPILLMDDYGKLHLIGEDGEMAELVAGENERKSDEWLPSDGDDSLLRKGLVLTPDVEDKKTIVLTGLPKDDSKEKIQ